MQEILQTIALTNLIDYCVKNKLDCAGTYIYKTPRKFCYTLLKNETKKPVCSVEYDKGTRPKYLTYTTN